MSLTAGGGGAGPGTREGTREGHGNRPDRTFPDARRRTSPPLTVCDEDILKKEGGQPVLTSIVTLCGNWGKRLILACRLAADHKLISREALELQVDCPFMIQDVAHLNLLWWSVSSAVPEVLIVKIATYSRPVPRRNGKLWLPALPRKKEKCVSASFLEPL